MLYTHFNPTATEETFPSIILQQLITQGRTAATIVENPIKHAQDKAQPL